MQSSTANAEWFYYNTRRGDVVEVVESAILDGELFADNDAGVRDFIVHPLVIKQLIEQD